MCPKIRSLEDLEVEWDVNKNDGLIHQQPTKKKGWWVCARNHSWQTRISHRLNGSNCPYCAGQKKVPGVNDFATQHPLIFEEWDHARQVYDPHKSVNAYGKVWWRGKDCQHSWAATIASRKTGSGCPYCVGQKVLQGFNDLASQEPALASEWHPKNKILPHEVALHSAKKVWWRCSRNHEWEKSIHHRVQGENCPYCSGRRVSVGETDLFSTHPHLAVEWDWDKNQFLPTEVSAGMKHKIWWKCANGHSYQAALYNRKAGKGCGKCVTSKPEARLYDELLRIDSHWEHGILLPVHWRTKTYAKVDIYHPIVKCVVEYDGAYWHQHKLEIDKDKTLKLLDSGYSVLRIREQPLSSLSITSSRYAEIIFASQQDLKDLSGRVHTFLDEMSA